MVLGLAILAQASGSRPRIMLNAMHVKHQTKDSLRANSHVKHGGTHQRAAAMKRELKATEVMVGRLSGTQGNTEARRVQSLLQAAARMAHHGAVAGVVHKRLSERFAWVFDDIRRNMQEESEVIGPAAAAAEERRALLGFASGMDHVAAIDGNILAMTKKAASRLAHKNGSIQISGGSAQLLRQAFTREERIVSDELKSAKLARTEAARLDRILRKHGRGNNDGAVVAKQSHRHPVTNAASEDYEHILSDMSTAKNRITGLLRGGKDAALARRLSKAIDGAEKAEASIASMESHELVQARDEFQKLKQLAAGTDLPKHAQVPAKHAKHTSARAQLRPMMQHVKEAMTKQVLIARREFRLANKSTVLAAELKQRSEALADGLRDSGESTDQEVAAEIENRLAKAESMLRQMAFIHKKLGREAARKVLTLSRQEQMLALAAHRHQ